MFGSKKRDGGTVDDLDTEEPSADTTPRTDRDHLEALVKALVGGQEFPTRLSWLETYKAQVDLAVESDPAFRETWEGDDPPASSECSREVADLIRDVRPALEAAARHLGFEELDGKTFGDDEDAPENPYDGCPEIPW